MNKEMIISSTPHETRVAILEDDQVVEIFIEREHSRGVVGNVYKGRVSKVLPGMQSAFVDLGLERDAFLYVTDVISPTEEALEDDEEIVPAALPEPAVELAAEGAAAADAELHAPDAEGAESVDHHELDANGRDVESDEDVRNGTLMPVAERPRSRATA
jgi:Rne/Rng family ribonuclease